MVEIILGSACALLALALTFYIGHITGKNSANTSTYAAMNSLINDWNCMLRRMPVMTGPTLDNGEPRERMPLTPEDSVL